MNKKIGYSIIDRIRYKQKIQDDDKVIKNSENKNDICNEINKLCKKQSELNAKLKELKLQETIDRFSRNEFKIYDTVTVKDKYIFMFDDVVDAKCNIFVNNNLGSFVYNYDIKFDIENIIDVDDIKYLQSSTFYIIIRKLTNSLNKSIKINAIHKHFDIPILISSVFVEAHIEDNNITVKC